jgi:hypothetical protein
MPLHLDEVAGLREELNEPCAYIANPEADNGSGWLRGSEAIGTT